MYGAAAPTPPPQGRHRAPLAHVALTVAGLLAYVAFVSTRDASPHLRSSLEEEAWVTTTAEVPRYTCRIENIAIREGNFASVVWRASAAARLGKHYSSTAVKRSTLPRRASRRDLVEERAELAEIWQ